MIHVETQKAVRVSDDGDDKRGVCLAKAEKAGAP